MAVRLCSLWWFVLSLPWRKWRWDRTERSSICRPQMAWHPGERASRNSWYHELTTDGRSQTFHRRLPCCPRTRSKYLALKREKQINLCRTVNPTFFTRFRYLVTWNSVNSVVTYVVTQIFPDNLWVNVPLQYLPRVRIWRLVEEIQDGGGKLFRMLGIWTNSPTKPILPNGPATKSSLKYFLHTALDAKSGLLKSIQQLKTKTAVRVILLRQNTRKRVRVS